MLVKHMLVRVAFEKFRKAVMLNEVVNLLQELNEAIEQHDNVYEQGPYTNIV